ncbi:E3 ubiquitin/ISG15 ligase TRIM25-like [Rana temporaria]|uniref:E3 ubiquitin/ISG15 ligase TRIM25-like n=1 Tax=Rana temporaria TaxID=8407 RepID=UPI001AAD8992|nr:E3 ubiquitin/ISG15 ligase TRIM25-like [Rana temporaria]
MAFADLRKELSCSICLSLYTEPVSLRCGHSFCRDCIISVLDTQKGSGVYTCPECRAKYPVRPLLEKNRKLCNIAKHFLDTQSQLEGSGVSCTYCLHAPIPAAKTCLQCETSLCDTHLGIHNKTVEHTLIDPTSSLDSWKCLIHKKNLEFLCCDDGAYICVYCSAIGSHKGHALKSLDEVVRVKEKLRKLLEKQSSKKEETEKNLESLQDLRRKVQEKTSVLTERIAELFTDIRKQLECLEKRFLTQLSRHEKQSLLSVSDLIRQLETQKDELCRKMQHIEELFNMTDPITVLQDQDLDAEDAAKTDKDSEAITQDIRKIRSSSELKERLVSVSLHACFSDVMSAVKRGLYDPKTSDILLDLDTACRKVSVTGDLKSASWSETPLSYPENAKRFTTFPQVMSSKGFSTGKHYWEVETSQSEDWWVGVAYPSIYRAGKESRIGENNKSWSLRTYDNHYSVTHNSRSRQLQTKIPIQKLGIYLDYEGGHLSFYQLCDVVRHLHTFRATFTEPLHAAFFVWNEGWIRLRS